MTSTPGRLLVSALVLVLETAAGHAVCVTDTAVADFAAGGGTCYVADGSGGELVLEGTEATEFDGLALPPGWALFDWNPPTGATTTSVGGGVITVNSARVNPDPVPPYGPGRSLEFVATFGAQPFQHVGFGEGTQLGGTAVYNAPSWIMFSTGATGAQLQARIDNNVGPSVDADLGAGFFGTSHAYRIDWGVTQIDFYIDGALVHSETAELVGADMRPAISDFATALPALVVDWIRMTPYVTPCTFDSRVFDGGNAGADWTDLLRTLDTPAGTGVVLSTRTGNTPTPDGSWSSFVATGPGTTVNSPTARYLQYRAVLSTTDADETPAVLDAQACFTACTPSAEVCDGADNDCDGQTDEAAEVNPCASGAPGVCSVGTCTAGVCVPNITPGSQTELCNGLDDDCDGAADDGDPGGGGSCSTGNPGICAAGTQHCVGATIVCQQNSSPTSEICNTLDDDCDGLADEGNPGGGGACATGQPGVCAPGTNACVGGNVVCEPNLTPGAEACDGLDNNCNGTTDEGNPGGGGACVVPAQQGVCAEGVAVCSGGALTCPQVNTPSTELCDTLEDEDCNGQVDEPACVLCPVANTVVLTTQTRRTTVQLRADPASDKIQTKGQLTQTPNLIDPDSQAVTFRIKDGGGNEHYAVTIPAGHLVQSPSGRTFRFSDPTAAIVPGVRLAKFSIKSDQTSVKYVFKAQGLDSAAFADGTGTVTVQVSTTCFTDDADACTVSASGNAARCR